MKVVVIGVGQVGRSVAHALSEDHGVVRGNTTLRPGVEARQCLEPDGAEENDSEKRPDEELGGTQGSPPRAEDRARTGGAVVGRGGPSKAKGRFGEFSGGDGKTRKGGLLSRSE